MNERAGGGSGSDPFEVMALQLRDTVRAAARELPFEVGMALGFAPGREGAQGG